MNAPSEFGDATQLGRSMIFLRMISGPVINQDSGDTNPAVLMNLVEVFCPNELTEEHEDKAFDPEVFDRL